MLRKISDFTPLTIHDFEEIRKMSDPYYLSRLTRMNNRLLETIEANKKKKGYTVNESGEVKDEDLFYSITSKFKGKVILVDFLGDLVRSLCKNGYETDETDEERS